MSAERGWIGDPQPLGYGVEGWAARHRDMGHHPHPAPTTENPERWDCDCHYIWRILTVEQIRMKYTAIKHAQSHDTSVAWWDCPTCRARLGAS